MEDAPRSCHRPLVSLQRRADNATYIVEIIDCLIFRKPEITDGEQGWEVTANGITLFSVHMYISVTQHLYDSTTDAKQQLNIAYQNLLYPCVFVYGCMCVFYDLCVCEVRTWLRVFVFLETGQYHSDMGWYPMSERPLACPANYRFRRVHVTLVKTTPYLDFLQQILVVLGVTLVL